MMTYHSGRCNHNQACQVFAPNFLELYTIYPLSMHRTHNTFWARECASIQWPMDAQKKTLQCWLILHVLTNTARRCCITCYTDNETKALHSTCSNSLPNGCITGSNGTEWYICASGAYYPSRVASSSSFQTSFIQRLANLCNHPHNHLLFLLFLLSLHLQDRQSINELQITIKKYKS